MATSLSAGLIINDILSNDEAVSSIATDVFPIVSDEAKLPYVSYRRINYDQDPAKSNYGSDTIQVEVDCYAEKYAQSVELAEAVRAALDGVQKGVDDVTMRSCFLSSSSEDWENDAFVQSLIFTIKI